MEMGPLEQKLSLEIENLDSLLLTLQSIQDDFEKRAKEKFLVDDYYDILVALGSGKEIRERLSVIIRRESESRNEGKENNTIKKLFQ
jgi:hypothetical protein